MLILPYDAGKLWDESKQEFFNVPDGVAELEYSLLSISMWESKYHKSFMNSKDKTNAELVYYIRCMNVTGRLLPHEIALLLATKNEYVKAIKEYLDDPMTATIINAPSAPRKSSESVTSELIYYWMVAHQIPFSCEKWNIKRLLKLIEVCNAKNQKPKKMSKNDNMRRHASLNASRRKARGH